MKTLIVDDNAEERGILAFYLKERGCEIIEADDGRQGLEMALSQRPGLIISDALMPNMDGFHFLREVRKSKQIASIPFVFYSSVYTGAREEELAISLGADAFIAKPKDPDEFWHELSSVLTRCSVNAQQTRVPQIREEDEFLGKYSTISVNTALLWQPNWRRSAVSWRWPTHH